jgi:hypothetical protein
MAVAGFTLVAMPVVTILLSSAAAWLGRWIQLHPEKLLPRGHFAADSMSARIYRIQIACMGQLRGLCRDVERSSRRLRAGNSQAAVHAPNRLVCGRGAGDRSGDLCAPGSECPATAAVGFDQSILAIS